MRDFLIYVAQDPIVFKEIFNKLSAFFLNRDIVDSYLLLLFVINSYYLGKVLIFPTSAPKTFKIHNTKSDIWFLIVKLLLGVIVPITILVQSRTSPSEAISISLKRPEISKINFVDEITISNVAPFSAAPIKTAFRLRDFFVSGFYEFTREFFKDNYAPVFSRPSQNIAFYTSFLTGNTMEMKALRLTSEWTTFLSETIENAFFASYLLNEEKKDVSAIAEEAIEKRDLLKEKYPDSYLEFASKYKYVIRNLIIRIPFASFADDNITEIMSKVISSTKEEKLIQDGEKFLNYCTSYMYDLSKWLLNTRVTLLYDNKEEKVHIYIASLSFNNSGDFGNFDPYFEGTIEKVHGDLNKYVAKIREENIKQNINDRTLMELYNNSESAKKILSAAAFDSYMKNIYMQTFGDKINERELFALKLSMKKQLETQVQMLNYFSWLTGPISNIIFLILLCIFPYVGFLWLNPKTLPIFKGYGKAFVFIFLFENINMYFEFFINYEISKKLELFVNSYINPSGAIGDVLLNFPHLTSLIWVLITGYVAILGLLASLGNRNSIVGFFISELEKNTRRNVDSSVHGAWSLGNTTINDRSICNYSGWNYDRNNSSYNNMSTHLERYLALSLKNISPTLGIILGVSPGASITSLKEKARELYFNSQAFGYIRTAVERQIREYNEYGKFANNPLVYTPMVIRSIVQSYNMKIDYTAFKSLNMSAEQYAYASALTRYFVVQNTSTLSPDFLKEPLKFVYKIVDSVIPLSEKGKQIVKDAVQQAAAIYLSKGMFSGLKTAISGGAAAAGGSGAAAGGAGAAAAGGAALPVVLGVAAITALAYAGNECFYVAKSDNVNLRQNLEYHTLKLKALAGMSMGLVRGFAGSLPIIKQTKLNSLIPSWYVKGNVSTSLHIAQTSLASILASAQDKKMEKFKEYTNKYEPLANSPGGGFVRNVNEFVEKNQELVNKIFSGERIDISLEERTQLNTLLNQMNKERFVASGEDIKVDLLQKLELNVKSSFNFIRHVGNLAETGIGKIQDFMGIESKQKGNMTETTKANSINLDQNVSSFIGGLRSNPIVKSIQDVTTKIYKSLAGFYQNIYPVSIKDAKTIMLQETSRAIDNPFSMAYLEFTQNAYQTIGPKLKYLDPKLGQDLINLAKDFGIKEMVPLNLSEKMMLNTNNNTINLYNNITMKEQPLNISDNQAFLVQIQGSGEWIPLSRDAVTNSYQSVANLHQNNRLNFEKTHKKTMQKYLVFQENGESYSTTSRDLIGRDYKEIFTIERFEPLEAYRSLYKPQDSNTQALLLMTVQTTTRDNNDRIILKRSWVMAKEENDQMAPFIGSSDVTYDKAIQIIGKMNKFLYPQKE